MILLSYLVKNTLKWLLINLMLYLDLRGFFFLFARWVQEGDRWPITGNSKSTFPIISSPDKIIAKTPCHHYCIWVMLLCQDSISYTPLYSLSLSPLYLLTFFFLLPVFSQFEWYLSMRMRTYGCLYVHIGKVLLSCHAGNQKEVFVWTWMAFVSSVMLQNIFRNSTSTLTEAQYSLK